MSIAQVDPRIVELLDYAIATGIPLPFPAQTICEMEDNGLVVDLASGVVSQAEPFLSSPVALSPLGWQRYHELSEARHVAAA